jgi:ribosomal protein S18 acetylase RimI-like enzyme
MRRTQARQAAGRAAAAIRPVRPADLAALGDFFAGLSARTRYLRFFGPVTPGPDLLRLLSGCGDHTDALVAVQGGVIIGHGMAADRTGPGGARMTDIGVVVADAWQARGIGSALMRALVAGAQARGVTSLAMDVLPDNYPVLAMIKGHWPGSRIGHSRDGVAFCVRLPRHRQERPRTRRAPVAPVNPRPPTAPAPAPPRVNESGILPRRTGRLPQPLVMDDPLRTSDTLHQLPESA